MIYPLDEQIENLIATVVDEETGEVTISDEELEKAIEQLGMEFDNQILALRNSYLETMLKAKMVGAEAKVLRDEAAGKQKSANALENKAERIKRFVAYLLKGEKFDKDGAKISYRKSEGIVMEDRFVAWCKQNRPELLDMKVKKADVMNALKAGDKLSYVHIEERRNIQIK